MIRPWHVHRPPPLPHSLRQQNSHQEIIIAHPHRGLTVRPQRHAFLLTPGSAFKRWNRSLAYWLPSFEWCSRLSGLHRRQIGMMRASVKMPHTVISAFNAQQTLASRGEQH